MMTKPEEIAKLSGDNSREEKERVMTGFLSGWVEVLSKLYFTITSREFQVLVSTDCAGMGTHVPGLNLVVNIGERTCLWKLVYIAVLPRAAKESVEAGPAGWQGWAGQRQPSSLCHCPLARTER